MKMILKIQSGKVPKWLCLSLLPFTLMAQTATPDTLAAQFQQYQLHALQEKLFVHTDKTFYLAGEIMWFKIYAVDAFQNKPLDVSKVVYTELLNKDHKPVMQAKIPMVDAMGTGSFLLPNSIVSGNYIFRAYTRWMENFSADFFYEQPVTIVNTLKELPARTPPYTKTYDIQFFPEGGNLVYGLLSKTAFKVVDLDGKGVDCSGYLMNNTNDTMLNFSTLKFGTGNFSFTPAKNETYTAVVKLPDTVISKSITGILPQGYVMKLETAAEDRLKVLVHTSITTANSNVYLFVHTRHVLKSVLQNTFINGVASFLVDKKLLDDGVSHFTVFNGDKKPVCERLFFKQPENKLAIEVVTDQKEYKTRGKVNLILATKDSLGNKATNAAVSVSVFKTDALQHEAYTDIRSYLLLSSDLTGQIDSPAYYFENKNAEEAAENLMLTQGWRRFKWSEVQKGQKPVFKFLPEAEGLTISAKTGGIINDAAGIRIPAVLTVADSNYIFRPAYTDETGNISFNVKDLYGNTDLIVQAVNPADSIFSFELLSPYADEFPSRSIPTLLLNEKLTPELKNRSIAVQVEGAYQASRKFQSIAIVKDDVMAFYGKPDFRYLLDNYTRFVTMEEVIKEFVTGVRVRRNNDNFNIRVLNIDQKNFFEKDPLILIDGLPVFAPGKIMAFDPLKIKKIEVVNRRYFIGNFDYDGIVSLGTYDGDLAGYPLDPAAIVIDYDGLQQQRQFYTPLYGSSATSASNRLPDLRNQLYWLPEVKTSVANKTSCDFWTSDLTGKFVIVVQGITKDGLAGSKITPFEVKAR